MSEVAGSRATAYSDHRNRHGGWPSSPVPPLPGRTGITRGIALKARRDPRAHEAGVRTVRATLP
jgi:hypothetical protein